MIRSIAIAGLVVATLASAGARAARAGARSPALRATPDTVDISESDAVDLDAEGVGEGARLVVEAGRVEPLAAGPGHLRGRWVLPRDLKPRRIAAAVVDGEAAAFTVVSVWRRARLHVTASPHARVRLRLGGELVAEGTASATGRLDLEVRVPPAVDLADVEQELSGKSDAMRKLQELDVRNELHVLAVALAEAVPADGSTVVPVVALSYRDDGGAGAQLTRAAVDDGRVLAPEAQPDGVARLSVTAGPWTDRPPPAALGLTLYAHDAEGGGTGALAIPIARLAPREVHLSAPPQPWKAGEVVEVTAFVTDAADRVMDEVPLTAAVAKGATDPPIDLVAGGAAPGHGQRFLLRAPQRLPGAEASYVLAVRAGEGPVAELPIRLGAGAPASLRVSVGVPVRGGFELAVEALDRFGNAVADPAPMLAASAGRVTTEPDARAGGRTAEWLAPDPRRSSDAVIEASFPGTSVRAVATVRYLAPGPKLALGTYGGFTGDAAAIAGPSLTLVASYAPSFLPRDLGLVLSLGAVRATRAQRAERPFADVELQRSTILAPVTLGGEWRLGLGRRLWVGLGVGTGALVSSASTAVREGDSPLRPTTTAVGVSWLWRAGLRLGVGLGPGELSLLCEAWDAVTGASTFAGGPRAGTAAVGYIVELGP